MISPVPMPAIAATAAADAATMGLETMAVTPRNRQTAMTMNRITA
jgi:hypothetical protein